jgi:HK97 family phage major capsid protein
VQSTGGTGQWVKEGAAKPLTQWTYTRTKLAPLKVAAIAAATKEQLNRASIAADTLIRDELARAVNARIDGTLISDLAAVSDESPAGLLNSTAALTLTGDGTISGIRCDIAAFMKELVTDNLSVAGAFWVMPETVAIDLAMAANEIGAAAFPGIGPTGGTLAGLPVFTSQYVPTATDGPVVALIKGDEIFLGDEGGVTVSVSDQASLHMDDAPNSNSTTPTAAQTVSMWQTNSVAFLVERHLNWQKRRAEAVVWANVNWNACAS